MTIFKIMLNTIRQTINALKRPQKQLILIAFDMAALTFAMWLAASMRYGVWWRPLPAQVPLALLAPLISLPVFIRMGLYRAVIRYLPDRAIWTMLKAVAYSAMIWTAIAYASFTFDLAYLPRSLPIIYWLVASALVIASRFAARALLTERESGAESERRIIVFGATRASMAFTDAARSAGAVPVAFIDNDPSLRHRRVLDLPVYPADQLAHAVSAHRATEVVVDLASINAEQRQKTFREFFKLGISLRALPSVALSGQNVSVSQLRQIDIDDLLGRSTVAPRAEMLAKMITDRTILVTGAGGSIGSELTRIIARHRPQKLVVLEANEFALYQLERKLNAAGNVPLVPVLGNVTDASMLERLFASHPFDAVFHAAAHKHVPLLEDNVLEGIRNNVFGTRNVAEAALQAGVKNVVLISTDKAVHPSSVMGATKRWAELVVRDAGKRAGQAGKDQYFCVVRFGNVLGSNGSVVPLFREQIEAGGPVTITDDRMTRFFMSIHEAAELIVQAAALSRGGDLFVLEMGRPLRIRDLAENMIRLAGKTVRDEKRPNGDIEIRVTGMRRGEKLTEDLFYEPAKVQPTEHPMILRSTGANGTGIDMADALAKLRAAVESGDEIRSRELLFSTLKDELASWDGKKPEPADTSSQ